MKRAAIVIVMLGITAWSFGQSTDKPAAQNVPAGQQPAAATQGKRPPQAKTQPEFDAWNAAKQLTDPAAQEKAADDFVAKFPESELRSVLYTLAMHGYQQANNAEKMMDMAKKVLSYDPDDPEEQRPEKPLQIGHEARCAERRWGCDDERLERHRSTPGYGELRLA